MRVQLISADENDFQPLGLASAAAYLRSAGFPVRTTDLTRGRPPTDEELADADLVAFSVPIFGAIEPSLERAASLRGAGYSGPIVFYNQYATVHPMSYALDERCAVILGEYEETLVAIARRLEQGETLDGCPHVWTGRGPLPPRRVSRESYLAPDRSTLPDLGDYIRTDAGTVVGNVETMRGCAHRCTYCSVYAAYQKRVVRFPLQPILQDVASCVRLGAGHITFVDADYFSRGKSALDVVETMHARHPWLTFDITARLDDILRYGDLVRRMQELGLTEITTAVEFPDDGLLEVFEKRISVEQTYAAFDFCKRHGVTLRPTFISFTPWVGADKLDRLEGFIREVGAGGRVDAMQRTTRLLLYKGSPLLDRADTTELRLTDRGSYYEWAHPDPAVDELYQTRKRELGVTEDTKVRCCIKG